MNKLLYLAFAALPLMAVTSCNDDDDLPSVDITVNYENGVQVDGTVYAVMGDTLKITGVDVKPTRAGKQATGGIVTYSLNGLTYFVSAVSPYPCYIPTGDFYRQLRARYADANFRSRLHPGQSLHVHPSQIRREC